MFRIFISLLVLLGFFSCTVLKQAIPESDPNMFKKQSSLNQADEMKSSNPELVTEVKLGKLQNGITIRTESGKVITGGGTFTPTKFSNGWINPGDGFTKRWRESTGEKVTISRPGKDEMYGILEFSKVYKNCSDQPATRSYYIKIPESFFTDAQGGNITCLYEYYSCKPEYEGAKKENFTTWSLWISDVPF